ncbi:hypothetical protein HW555_012871 [Spodoptera exigua]|uniref:Uncharacterized protein n=1 Tax=Spodoptera exigua TaxID=7107 RepID=A0A835L347_SPOEX|nr:hypothetical protein HW555_012871 [Spodoptera exigua]
MKNIGFTKPKDFELYKESEHETSDHLARRIMDENMKVHLKLVTEFAKSTSDGSNMSSLDSTQEVVPAATETKSVPAKYEEKLTMTYDTNVPDDLKMSRNTYVNSLERPKSDMMKKLLAKNPILNVHIDQSSEREKEEASTSKETPQTDAFKSAMHQPDIVNFDLKTSQTEKPRDYDDFVSNIRIGSNNNSMNYSKKLETFSSDWTEPKDINTNVVTITTEKSQPVEEKRKSYRDHTKSIEIGEPTIRMMPPDVLEGIRRRHDERERTLYMEPASVSLTMTQEPVQKTVTVNVNEDEFGNKVITQNVEKISTKYMTTKTEAPLQVEQISFGIMRGGEINEMQLEEGDVKDIDKRVLDEIKRQNPNMHFTTDEPAYTRTETIILNTTEMNEEEAQALMEKLKNDPSFMSQKSPEELSRMGIRIIQDLEDVQTSTADSVEVTKTRYSINPSITDVQKDCKEGDSQKDHITEIQVVTPRTEQMQKQKESKDKISSRQRAPPYEEPPLSYELDIELLNDFIHNERHVSAKQLADEQKRAKTNQSNEPKKRHSDFDLPRNSHIKFRTATYESPKGTIVTSTDLENRRLSQLDQLQLRSPEQQKPQISAKPSNIPVKAEKSKVSPGVSSKIPVFTTQKSLSQENLTDTKFSLPRSPPPQFSSSGNISVTSIIKSSSRSPSGGKL